MDKSYTKAGERSPEQKIRDTAAYSARMQEAMRYDRISSSDYPLVMAIRHAVSQGDTEEKWKEEQQQKRKTFVSANDDYEQLVQRLKDLMLWPW